MDNLTHEQQLKDAVVDNDHKKVKNLLNKSPKVFKYHTTLMLLAAEYSSWDITRSLIDHGADVNAIGKLDLTVAMKAAMAGRADIIGLLIEKGADMEKSRSSMYHLSKPLDFALESKDSGGKEVADLIISHLEQKQLEKLISTQNAQQSVSF